VRQVAELDPPIVEVEIDRLLRPVADKPGGRNRLKRRWSYFMQKVYETDSLVCPKCSGEMRIISFLDRPDVIKKILEHLSLREESHPPQIEAMCSSA
jgi:hypothetical protein